MPIFITYARPRLFRSPPPTQPSTRSRPPYFTQAATTHLNLARKARQQCLSRHAALQENYLAQLTGRIAWRWPIYRPYQWVSQGMSRSGLLLRSPTSPHRLLGFCEDCQDERRNPNTEYDSILDLKSGRRQTTGLRACWASSSCAFCPRGGREAFGC